MAIKDTMYKNVLKLKSYFIKNRLSPIFYLLIFSVLLQIPVLLSGCAKKTPPVQKMPVRIKADAIRTSYKTIAEYLKSSGNMVSVDNTVISAHIMGYVIYENIHLGQSVKKGQLLLKLSAPEIKSKYYAAEAALINAKKTYNRINTLYKENSVARQTYDNAFMRYKVAKANLNTASSYMGYKNIYSPIDGVITQKKVSMGDLAAPGRMLFMIQNINDLEFKTNVNARYYHDIILSDKTVRLNINSADRTIIGYVVSVVKSANPYSHSVIVRIKISRQEGHGILPGMYGVASFKIGKRKVIIIPRTALIKKLGVSGVYIANNEGEVMFQPIKKGEVYGRNYIVVLNGLSPNLTLITSDLNKISVGSYVNPVFLKQ